MCEWWWDVVIYQIYLWFFQDDNGDGIGDLVGIICCLDYVVGLGVDVIWLLLFFMLLDCDMGYDVFDYKGVNLFFGMIEDFDVLVVCVYELGLKVIIDQVLLYSLIEYFWFEESCQDKINFKVDWYVWVDFKVDGILFNNWFLVFGGSVWIFDVWWCQYYMYNFLIEQLDLNFYNFEVVEVLFDVMEFWLECGVDGF